MQFCFFFPPRRSNCFTVGTHKHSLKYNAYVRDYRTIVTIVQCKNISAAGGERVGDLSTIWAPP